MVNWRILDIDGRKARIRLANAYRQMCAAGLTCQRFFQMFKGA